MCPACTGNATPRFPAVGSAVLCSAVLADPGRLYHLLQQHLAECNGAALSNHLSSPEHLQLLSTAVHLGTDTPTLLGLLVGSFGLPASSHAAAAVASSLESSGPPAQQLRKSLSSAGPAAAAGSGLGVGIGLHLLPLVGVLADKYGHAASELGGPVTEALVQAQLSTVARVQDLEARCRSLHRCVPPEPWSGPFRPCCGRLDMQFNELWVLSAPWRDLCHSWQPPAVAAAAAVALPPVQCVSDCREVVMLKCTLAEQRKHEAARVEEALRDQKRKIARREARQPTLLEKFLQTKCVRVPMRNSACIFLQPCVVHSTAQQFRGFCVIAPVAVTVTPVCEEVLFCRVVCCLQVGLTFQRHRHV